MRVKISTNSPLPPLKAWFPLQTESAQTISSFKALLCASLPVLRGVSSSSLHLSIDGFELLDSSELTVIRDGDLICIGALDTLCSDATVPLGRVVDSGTAASHKRKRRASTTSSSASSAPDADSNSSSGPPKTRPKTLQQARRGPGFAASPKQKRGVSMPSSSSSASDSESTTSESATSDEESTSESDDSSRATRMSLRKVEPPKIQVREVLGAKSHVAQPTTFVPPGYGKAQTRSRNLRRRMKRMHERDATGVSEEGPVSGANAAVPEKQSMVPATGNTNTMSGLMSLSLRNKNKAKNFRALIGKPLPPKIIFGDQEGDGSIEIAVTPECPTPAEDTCKSQTSSRVVPRLIPPSSRSSLPPNLFVTSVDVEANLHKKKRKTSEEEVTEVVVSGGDARLESLAEERWQKLTKLTNEKQIMPGTAVGYKALGIDPITYTPGFLLTVGHVQSCDARSVLLRPLRERENVSFGGPVEDGDAEVAVQEHTWVEILAGDWRVVE